ncbi:MAG: hypothetical protein ACJ0F4_01870 [Gammaproteobacteria bacterium]
MGIKKSPSKTENEDEYLVTHRDKRPENEKNTDIATVYRGEVSISIIKPSFLHKEDNRDLQTELNLEISRWLEK